jgi:DNA replication protein DnaC
MANRQCPVCQGTGWKPVEADGVRRVVRCDCQQAEHTRQLLESARIPRRYEQCAFENFDIRKDKETGRANPSLAAAKLYAERFVEEYPTDFGLLFVGPTGVGKTHLAVAILRELILRKSVECVFCDFRDLLKEIQDSYNPVSQSSEWRILQSLVDVEVLLLDELSGANPSDWVKETLSHLVNSRYNQKKVTLITTTLPFGESSRRAGSEVRGARGEIRAPSGEAIPDVDRTLAQLGVTLRSRLYEMCKLVEISSDDFRKAVKQAGYKFHVE